MVFAIILALALPAAAQHKVKPLPTGPRGEYLVHLRGQAKALVEHRRALPQAFQRSLAPMPAVRTPAAFAARFALTQALARPGGLAELAEAVAEHDGRKAVKAVQALENLASAIGRAGDPARTALAGEARALLERFDGATAAPGESVDLEALAADAEGPGRREARRRMKEERRRMMELQDRLAQGKSRGLLLVLQGLDAAGKGGVIKRPLRLDPGSLRVKAFKKPTPEQAARDYRDRIIPELPAPGVIVVFDRSHYEDIAMPTVLRTHPSAEIESRYGKNIELERGLHEKGIPVVKAFLHVSREEQGRRLQERIDDPKKHSKASVMDLEMRRRRPELLKAWGEVLARTSPPWAIWTVIPADHEPRRDLGVARLARKTLQRMGLTYPPLDPELVGVKVD